LSGRTGGAQDRRMTTREAFAVHTLDSAPDAARPALSELEQRIGFIPNLAATMAGSPVLINGFGGLQEALRTTTLTGAEREVVGLTVSHENASRYSMAAHSVFAKAQGAADAVVDALRSGTAPPDAKLRALHEFTLAVLRERGHVPAERVDALRAAGYTTEQLLEVIAQIGYTSIANWIANICDTAVDGAFQAQVWS
jgi:alkylhydroperoxidase family enzyme